MNLVNCTRTLSQCLTNAMKSLPFFLPTKVSKKKQRKRGASLLDYVDNHFNTKIGNFGFTQEMPKMFSKTVSLKTAMHCENNGL